MKQCQQSKVEAELDDLEQLLLEMTHEFEHRSIDMAEIETKNAEPYRTSACPGCAELKARMDAKLEEVRAARRAEENARYDTEEQLKKLRRDTAAITSWWERRVSFPWTLLLSWLIAVMVGVPIAWCATSLHQGTFASALAWVLVIPATLSGAALEFYLWIRFADKKGLFDD